MSEPPRDKTTALTHNEEYCPVAIYNLLTENIEHVVLQRIWGYKEKIFDKKKNKQTGQMMRNILTHVYLKWREQRSTSARVPDPENQDKMKRRRTGVVHTTQDKIFMKWSGCKRWLEFSEDWEKFHDDG